MAHARTRRGKNTAWSSESPRVQGFFWLHSTQTTTRLCLVAATLFTSVACSVRREGVLAGPPPVGTTTVELAGSHRRGAASVVLSGGKRCEGRFNTVAAEVDSIDHEGFGDAELSQVGVLVFSCPGGRVIRCEFSRSWYGPGKGVCTGPLGREYALVLQ